MNKGKGLLRLFVEFAAIAFGITLALFVFAYTGMTDKSLLLPLIICVTAVAVAAIVMRPVMHRLSLRTAALKAMGKDGFKAVVRDKVARVAYQGVYQFIKGDYPAAEERLTKALNLSDVRQNQVFCIEWLIRLYEHINNSSKLLWSYRKAVEYSPDNPEAQSRLGYAYYVDGKLENAMYCFGQAIHYDPNHGYSHYSIAKIHIIRGEDEKAIEVLENLIKIQENHPLIYAELSVIYAMNNNEEKSQECYNKAILCGYEDTEALSKRITAIRIFNNAENAGGDDLPQDYYRYIEKSEDSNNK